MEALIDILHKEKVTCVIRKDGIIYRERGRGIAPLLRFLEDGRLENADVADKVIGKAAAMLMVYGGVRRIYTDVISAPARKFLTESNVKVCFQQECSYIINRAGTGMCPMEQCVLTCSNPQEAYLLLKRKLAEYSGS